MHCYITDINGMHGTSKRAQDMVANIAMDSLGFRPMGIYTYHIDHEPKEQLSARLDGIISPLEVGDVVVVQMPTWINAEYDQQLFERIKLYDAHLVIFIQDIKSLFPNQEVLQKEIDLYNKAEVVIAHTSQMVDFLRKHGLRVKHTISLDLMDHYFNGDFQHPAQYSSTIHFASQIEKAKFINDWQIPKSLTVRLFDQRPAWANNPRIDFVGRKADVELLYDLHRHGGFGLNWTNDPQMGKYYSINDSFKLSTYFAAGIPVIAQSSIAQHEMIRQKHLGILADSLDEAARKVEQTTPEEYQAMTANVEHLGQLVRGGYFTKRALVKMMFDVFG